MKISELQKQLGRAKELHGDVEVYMEGCLGKNDFFFTTVERVMKHEGKIIVDWRTG